MPQQWRIASQATSPTSSVRSWQSSGSPQRGPFAPASAPTRRQSAAEALAQRGIHLGRPRKSAEILALTTGEPTAHTLLQTQKQSKNFADANYKPFLQALAVPDFSSPFEHMRQMPQLELMNEPSRPSGRTALTDAPEPSRPSGRMVGEAASPSSSSKRPHEPDPTGAAPVTLTAPARPEKKVRLQSDPVLEKHIGRLETQNAEQHKQIETLQKELDKSRKENLESFQAAQRHEGIESSRRLEEHREAGLQLQTQLEACRLQISTAAALVAQKDMQANELAAKLLLCCCCCCCCLWGHFWRWCGAVCQAGARIIHRSDHVNNFKCFFALSGWLVGSILVPKTSKKHESNVECDSLCFFN